jgi:hypothetical protein|tara:strand:+ start:89 stop:220 length:132 start_codon:yes stop_codon:yes gene_type:complete
MEEIAEELIETIKWIPKIERQSKWYNEYLTKINNDLQKANLNE